jgi:hypothetical protein
MMEVEQTAEPQIALAAEKFTKAGKIKQTSRKPLAPVTADNR